MLAREVCKNARAGCFAMRVPLNNQTPPIDSLLLTLFLCLLVMCCLFGMCFVKTESEMASAWSP
jgi:hypothetical protein